jgi:hypothetical protein
MEKNRKMVAIVFPKHGNDKDLFPWIFLLAGVITRIPFSSRFLLHMDSGQFVLALEKFDVTVHQPHPPGYFLYVMLGRVIHLFVDDGNAVFVSVSVLFSGLTMVAVYRLGKEMFDTETGAIAALLALASPNVWFHGEVALTYIAEAFFSTAIAFCCWKTINGEEKYVWISAIALGIAGGIRQNTIVFLLPLWIYSMRHLTKGKILACFALLGGTTLLWFVPMIRMSGGWSSYRSALRELWVFHTGGHSFYDGGWASFKVFSFALLSHLVHGLGAGVFPLVLSFYSMIRRGKSRLLDRKKVMFFSLWILPTMFFYLFIFISVQNPGYVLMLLPAFFLMTSISILYLGKELTERYGKNASPWIIFLLVVLNTAMFFSLKTPVSYRWIKHHDQELALLLKEIRTFDPGETAIFVNNYIYYSYRHVMVYLPQYRVYNVDVRESSSGERRKTFWGIHGKTYLAEEITLPAKVRRFVSPLDIGDGKYWEKEAYEKAGICIKEISPDLRLASGGGDLLRYLYPHLGATSTTRKDLGGLRGGCFP